MDSEQINSTTGQVSKGAVDLPQEIISDILCRLPIESILACGVVCKTWYAVTKDPCFINRLGKSHYRPTQFLLKPLCEENISDSLSHLVLLDIERCKTRRIPIEKMIGELQIMCSCNGLLCMASAENLNPVVIYNPITREQVILPSSDSEFAIPISNHDVGLGFDPSTDKYKVVRAYTVFVSMVRVRRFEIMSLGESSWRKLNVPQSIVNRGGLGVGSWNGALYWTMNRGNSIIVVQFDLRDENFRVISSPNGFFSAHGSVGLINVGGCLTLVHHNDGIIELWRLTENEVGGDLSFRLQDTYATHVIWGRGLCCFFLCQLNQESYLLQVGFWNRQMQRQDHLTRYFPERILYSSLEISGLPSSFKTIAFKPNLVPLTGV